MMKKELLNSKNSIFLVILFLILIDQLTKYYFTYKYYFENFIIQIYYSKNTGSALGIFSSFKYYNYFIISLSIIILIILILKKDYFLNNKFYKISFILLVSGIFGNLIDRFFLGYVRDFIVLKYFFIFNLADFYLSLSLIYFFLFELNKLNLIKK